MNDSHGFIRPAAPSLVILLVLAGALVLVSIVASWSGRRTRRSHAQDRDQEVVESLLSTPGEEISDGVIYPDPSSARQSARSYREPCRWRGLGFHYRVESAGGGYMWSAWTGPAQDPPEVHEDNDA